MTETKANAQTKATYSRPKLTVYGSVRNLTGGSAGPNNDGNGPRTSRTPKSDIRVKENVTQIGTHPAGFGVYLFDYKPEFRDEQGYGRQFGVLAQEVREIAPQAVGEDADGILHVDYAMLGMTRH